MNKILHNIGILTLSATLTTGCNNKPAPPQDNKTEFVVYNYPHKKATKLCKPFDAKAYREKTEAGRMTHDYNSITDSIDKLDAKDGPVVRVFPDTLVQGNTAIIKVKSLKPLKYPHFEYPEGVNLPLYKINDSIYTGYMASTPNIKSGEIDIPVKDLDNNLFKTVKLWIKGKVFENDSIQTTPAVSQLHATTNENHIIGMALRTKSDTAYFGAPPFQIPVKGRYRTEYGQKRVENGILKENYFHKGMDISAPEGTPIRPLQPGKVLVAQMFKLNGGTVIVDHGQGMVSAYLHMSKIDVKEGQKIGLKDIIGKVGSTGHSTGPHLHFGLYVNGKNVNPMQWLNKEALVYNPKKPTHSIRHAIKSLAGKVKHSIK